MGQTFFRREYRMNHLIATMQKNYVAVMDGITSLYNVLSVRHLSSLKRLQWAVALEYRCLDGFALRPRTRSGRCQVTSSLIIRIKP